MGITIGARLLILGAVLGTTVVLATMILASPALATPAYATATGQPCSACHTNPAGGGALTARGQAFAAIPTHAANPAAAWAQVTAPAAPAPAAPAPAAPAAPAPAAPAAPAAQPTARPAATPAPVAPPAAPPAAAAPRALPTTGDAGAASQVPLALAFMSAALAGLGVRLRRR